MGVNKELKNKCYKVSVHFGLGTEALVVAVSSIVGDDDNLLLSHRNAAYNLFRATDPIDVVHECELSRDGATFGCLGFMNILNPESGVRISLRLCPAVSCAASHLSPMASAKFLYR